MHPRILFDIGHPAHYHLFKNFMRFLKNEHVPFIIATRDKEVTNTLISHDGFGFHSLSSPGKGLLAMGKELIVRDLSIFGLHRKHKFTHAFGTSVSIAHLSMVSKVKSYNFNEDDDDVVPLYTKITYPFSTKIINPDCLNYKKWKNKRVLHSSYHELAYLHPNNFTPDINIIKSYDLQPKKYVIIRLSALAAHHDVGMKGISKDLLAKIKTLLKDYTIIESSELATQYKVKPWDMHHILAFAKMIISDSQTMTIEGAVLGIPALRINTFIDKSTVIAELENKYKLAYGFYPNDENSIVSTIAYLTQNHQIYSLWQEKLKIMLNDKIDFNQWMISYYINEIKNNTKLQYDTQ